MTNNYKRIKLWFPMGNYTIIEHISELLNFDNIEKIELMEV